MRVTKGVDKTLEVLFSGLLTVIIKIKHCNLVSCTEIIRLSKAFIVGNIL